MWKRGGERLLGWKWFGWFDFGERVEWRWKKEGESPKFEICEDTSVIQMCENKVNNAK